MSRNGAAGPVPAGGWLEGDQQRAWLAYIRVQLRHLREAGLADRLPAIGADTAPRAPRAVPQRRSR